MTYFKERIKLVEDKDLRRLLFKTNGKVEKMKRENEKLKAISEMEERKRTLFGEGVEI